MPLTIKTLTATIAIGSAVLFGTAARAETPVSLLVRSPVSLAACDIEYRSEAPSVIANLVPPTVADVDVRFENHRAIDATEVDVRVGYGGETSTLVDKGRFSQSTAIVHTFTAFAGSSYASVITEPCRVTAVRYADGSVWQAESGPVARLSAKP